MRISSLKVIKEESPSKSSGSTNEFTHSGIAENLLKFRDDLQEEDEHRMAMTSIETMHPDIFAATYYSLITKYAEQYNVSKEEQADNFFESLLVLGIQSIICVCVLFMFTTLPEY